MSCLLRVSKRLKNDTAPNDLAGVQDSVEYVSGAGLAADTSEAEWKVSDFGVFNELQKPIVVVSPGLYQKPSRWAKSEGLPLVIFQNLECQRRFGIPRSHAACCSLVNSLADDDCRTWSDWELEIMRGGKVHKSRIDIYALFKPLLQGVATDKPDCLVRLESKPIKVQVLPGEVQSAIMHIAELDASNEDLRVTAMHLRSPIHTLMFNSKGDLLAANSTALKACHAHAPGGAMETITLHTLFDMGLYPGGELEAHSCYEEAVNAVFNLQLTWRHMQPHCSRKDGKAKWSMIEMWPMHDPVDASPAVLVKRYNITQHKELEIQLATRQGDLLRQNEDLEQESVAMQGEKDRLQQEADKLAQQLQAVLSEKFVQRCTFDAETPIDKTLGYLQSVISGNTPPLQQALELHSILTQSDTNLRQPVALKEQLLMGRMGSDVGQSMLQMLQGETPRAQVRVRAKDTDEAPAPWSWHAPVLEAQDLMSAESIAMPLESVVPASIVPEVERLLKTAENSWQFDIFAFAEATQGHSLSLLFFHLVKQSGLLQVLGFDITKFCNFLRKMDAGYDPSNPYHNSIHVASVVQMTHMLLCHGGIMRNKVMDKGTLWATYWAALVHDYEHGGLNNDFLIKTAHPLAITYSDDSPLEHHHVAAATRIFLDPDCQYITKCDGLAMSCST
ncbi:3',5'-cyclic-nucleotide phosphodiesterase pde1 [Trebouxia sp. C0009 RCD-2024]